MSTASTPGPPLDFVNLADIEAAAAERLPLPVLDYYRGGANDELTLRENRRAFERLALRFRVLRDVSERRLETTVLGKPIAFPIMIAPMALQRMAHPDGEVATARAADEARTIMMVSTVASTTLEDIRRASTGRLWFQLYVFRDRAVTRDLVARAEAAGYEALVLTVDTPILGRRERDVRNRFRLPPGVVLANLIPTGQETLPHVSDDSGLAVHAAHVFDQSLGWRDVGWLKSITRLPVIVKGVVRGDDAAHAVAEGVAGIMVSNHGGRQLDTSIPTIDALPEVVDAVGDAAEVYVDGGIRRGTDVVKALALGARATMIGRPILWGLTVDGQRGVERVLALVRDELDLAMALCGVRDVTEVTNDLIAR